MKEREKERKHQVLVELDEELIIRLHKISQRIKFPMNGLINGYIRKGVTDTEEAERKKQALKDEIEWERDCKIDDDYHRAMEEMEDEQDLSTYLEPYQNSHGENY